MAPGRAADAEPPASAIVLNYNGLGFAEQGWARLDELARAALEHVEACPCESGCPSCVGLPILRPAQQQDPDLGHGRAIPGKEAARVLLRHWLSEPGPPAGEEVGGREEEGP